MQKGEAGKGGGGSSSAKRGRPFGGGGNSNSFSSSFAPDSIAPSALLGPSLQVHSAFAEWLTWALNTLTLLSFKERDEVRKEATPLAKIPGLLDALLQVIDDWRDISLPKELVKKPRLRMLGANSTVTGFGSEYKMPNINDTNPHPSVGSGSSIVEANAQKSTTKLHSSQWLADEDGLFNLDDEGRAEKQQCAVAASNILCNFSFMPENEVIMTQHRHCLETLFQCIEYHITEDDELVTNSLETMVNLAAMIDLRIFSSSKPSFIKMTEKLAVRAVMGILGSSVEGWYCAAAELIGCLIKNPDNETFLLPFAPQVNLGWICRYQAAAVGAIFHLVEINMDCRLRLASEQWAIDRLLKVIRHLILSQKFAGKLH